MDGRKAFLLGLSGVLALVAFLMVLPFIGYLLGAALLGFLLYPLQKRLAPFVGDTVAAGVLVLFGILVVVVPLTVFGVLVADEAVDVAQTVAGIPVIDVLEEVTDQVLGIDVDVAAGMTELVERFTGLVLDQFSAFVGAITTIGIGMVLLVFVTFYLLKDGARFVSWVKDTAPLTEQAASHLQERLHLTTWAVIKGHVLVAVVQGVLLGLGFAVAGLPNVIFWTFIMIVLGFIPLIGTVLVWLPAAIYLFMAGQVVAAVLLVVYGVLVATVSDEVIRPLVVDREADLHPAAILVGLLGGIYLFGPVGLFIGPVLIAALKEVIAVSTTSDM